MEGPQLLLAKVKNVVRQDWYIYYLNFTDKISEKELEGMASPPRNLDKEYFLAPTVLALNTLAATLSKRVCDPLPDPTPDDGKIITFHIIRPLIASSQRSR